jgi:hypothetical protein
MDHYRFLKRLEKKRIEIRSGMNFYQETKEYGGNRFTNFYWLEVNKGKYQIELKTADKLLPLKDFEKDNPMVLGGMNFGSFFLVDEACDPKCRYYNLVLSQGAILQLPSNSRTALQCNQSVLSQVFLEASGMLAIGNGQYTWSGINSNTRSQIKVFGMFDIDFQKITESRKSQRVIKKSTNIVNAKAGELLLGISVEDGIPTVVEVCNEELDLLDYYYILKSKERDLEHVCLGETLHSITFGNKVFEPAVSVCSGVFSLGRTRKELERNIYRELLSQPSGKPKPLEDEYVKSWAVVLENTDSYIFLINDGRPNVDSQRGVNIFELQDYLIEKFNYNWGIVADSGQSSKLMFVKDNKREILGNLYYINYKGEKPYWDGVNGRPISVAIVIHE